MNETVFYNSNVKVISQKGRYVEILAREVSFY